MNRRRHLLFSLTLVVATAITARANEVDDWVEAQMQLRHIPAASIAVIKDRVVVKTAGYGMANLEHNIPAHADTVFKIGSASKQFIAAGVMLLVQDGKVSVNDKVGKHLEGTPATWEAITLRHLLTHTSGLVREAPGFDPYKIQPDLDVIKSAYPVPLLFKPGDNYEYSNLGYYTLAEIIHRVSGKTWGDFLSERVFSPLGMTATRVTSAFDVIPNRADGYVWNEDKFSNAEDWTTLRPSGAFLSTAPDMAKWEVALQTDRLLNAATKKEMWTPVKLNDGKTYEYGFGWELGDFPNGVGATGVPVIRHEGTIPGFRAAFWRLPNHGITVIVLTNLERAALDNFVSGIAVRYVPALMPAYLKRWP